MKMRPSFVKWANTKVLCSFYFEYCHDKFCGEYSEKWTYFLWNRLLGFQLCNYVWMRIDREQFHGSDHNSNSELIIMNQDTKMFVLNIESFSNYYEWN